MIQLKGSECALEVITGREFGCNLTKVGFGYSERGMLVALEESVCLCLEISFVIVKCIMR